MDKMNRSVMFDCRKAEEKELSESIFKRLQRLSFCYPPTNDFRAVLNESMFLKTNMKAFFHIMHYLFTIHDSSEFKKRFYWPIYDKTSENAFRSSTVQYLNYLIEKHQLEWGPVKSFLVVMPGGMKFIAFLSNFIDFIIKEEIKKTKHNVQDYLTRENPVLDNRFLRILGLKRKKLVETSAQYKKSISEQTVKVSESTEKFKQVLEMLVSDLKIDSMELTTGTFLTELQASNKKLYDETIKKEIKSIEALNQPLEQLLEDITKFLNVKPEFPCNKEKLVESYQEIQRRFPDTCSIEPILTNDKINVESLLTAFIAIKPSLDEIMQNANMKSEETLAFEEEQLTKFVNELRSIENDVNRLENSIATRKRPPQITPNQQRYSSLTSQLNSSIKMKFVNTPPVVFNGSTDGGNLRRRLALLDENPNQENSFTNSLAGTSFLMPPKSAKKSLNASCLNSSRKSRIIDPMRLLRTISKQKRPKNSNDSRTLSDLASKWKEKESLIADTPQCSTTITNSTQRCLKSSANHSNDSRTLSDLASKWKEKESLIADSAQCSTTITNSTQRCLKSSASSSLHDTTNTFDTNETVRYQSKSHYEFVQQKRILTEKLLTGRSTQSPHNFSSERKNPILQHVQDGSFEMLDLKHLSTSPSGRLDPLVEFDKKDLVKIFVNDIPIESPSASLAKVNENLEENKENDFDLNIEFAKKLNLSSNNDLIFNMSDSVLNDLSI